MWKICLYNGVRWKSSALQDIFEFYGFTLSESMVFRLGGDICFGYWTTNRCPTVYGRRIDQVAHLIRDIPSNPAKNIETEEIP